MNESTKVLFVKLTGNAQERGYVYGSSCKEKILKNISYYKELIKLPEPILNQQAFRFGNMVELYNPDLKTEMDAIAKGAGVEPVDIYILNSRTELLALSGVVYSECSTFFFPKSKILFENWDWLDFSKDMSVLLSITLENGNKILTFTEAGMVGKIGMSSNGFGVAFNYLFPEPNNGGLPVHILLRSLLESNSYDEALEKLNKEHIGTSGNIMLASADGRNVDVELTGLSTKIISWSEKPLFHTNHYLSDAQNKPEAGEGFLHNSFERIERISELLPAEVEQTIENAKKVLSDRKPGGGMLCRDFLVEDPGDGKTGTIASVIMDLNTLTMQVCLSPQNNATYQTFSL